MHQCLYILNVGYVHVSNRQAYLTDVDVDVRCPVLVPFLLCPPKGKGPLWGAWSYKVASMVNTPLANPSKTAGVKIVTSFIKNSSDLLSADAKRVVLHVNEKSLVIVFKFCGHRGGLWKLKRCGSFTISSLTRACATVYCTCSTLTCQSQFRAHACCCHTTLEHGSIVTPRVDNIYPR